MKKRDEIKVILERNLGINGTPERLDLRALSEILDIEHYHLLVELKDMLRDLFGSNQYQLEDIVSSNDKTSPKYLDVIGHIHPELLKIPKFPGTKKSVFVLIEGEHITLSEIMVGIMMSRKNTVYAALVTETLHTLVEDFRSAGIKINGIEDLRLKNVIIHSFKKFMITTKDIFTQRFNQEVSKGNTNIHPESLEYQWTDMKHDLVDDVFDSLQRMEVLFGDDLEEYREEMKYSKEF